MVGVCEVVRQHGGDYLQRYGNAVLPSHVRALESIAACRTPALGGQLAVCSECGREHLLYHSCRHRACPRCGHDAASRWVERQRKLLLPVPYFHVVVTLPSELRRVVRSHQQPLLSVLFRAAFESLSALCADPRWLGGRLGALAVLHTWTRTLEWHPHLHLLVPGGGLGPDERTWVVPRARGRPFLVPVRVLGKHFRGRFLHLARRALPDVRLPAIPWGKRWVTYSKAAVQGPERVLEYLGRYVHRTALSDKAIVASSDRCVTFSYRDSRDHSRKTMTLVPHEFLRRFLQHVPMKGFHRVRAFGLLHPSKRLLLKRLQLLLSRRSTADAESPAPPIQEPRRDHCCPYCDSGTLRRVRRLTAKECACWLSNTTALRCDTARAPPPPGQEVLAA